MDETGAGCDRSSGRFISAGMTDLGPSTAGCLGVKPDLRSWVSAFLRDGFGLLVETTSGLAATGSG